MYFELEKRVIDPTLSPAFSFAMVQGKLILGTWRVIDDPATITPSLAYTVNTRYFEMRNCTKPMKPRLSNFPDYSGTLWSIDGTVSSSRGQ